MRIEDYAYGRIVVDGREEHRDLLLTRSGLHPNWWRREGHSLCLEDLDQVFADTPATLVLGTGTTGRMQPPADVLDQVRARGIDVEVMQTDDAVRRYNELVGLDVDVAAALHLTC